MNRKNLTAAVLAGLAGAAGIAGSAQAVNVNPDGIGQVLLYPYYTTNGGNQTLISVVNTSEEAKAVKVRFLEGENSVEVLDFNLYLSQYDVWVGALYEHEGNDLEAPYDIAAGTPTLQIPDNSCTVPYLHTNPNSEQKFLSLAMVDKGTAVPSPIGRAAEGHFEMIEMGSVVNEVDGFNTADAVTHVDKGGLVQEPADCAQLVAAWTDNTQPSMRGYWIKDWYETCSAFDGNGGIGTAGACDFNRYEAFEAFGYTDISTPTGGLFGGASIVDVQNGSMYSYDAIALAGFDDNDDGELHARPGLITPHLNSGNQVTGYAFLDDGDFEDWVFDGEGNNHDRSIDAVSYAIQHDAIMNEWTTEGEIGANTEWVVTFPTKNFYVHESRSNHEHAIRPFVAEWEDLESSASTNWGACEPVMLDSAWDRNEKPIVDPLSKPGEPIPPVVSPSVPGGFTTEGGLPFVLCYETNVIRFGTYDGADADLPYSGPTEILASNNVINFNTEDLGESGWARINLHEFREDDNGSGNPGFPDGVINGDDTLQNREALGNLTGLPVVGFSVQRFQNQFVGADSGKVANYGGIFSHRGTRKSCTFEACDAILGND